MPNLEAEKNSIKKEIGVHQGHRDRQYKSYIENGASAFKDHELLELLLFYGVHIKNTNEIAHNLLNKFGSLDKVFEAPLAELMQVSGIGRINSLLIKLIPDINKRCIESKNSSVKIIKTTEDVVSVTKPKFLGRKEELAVLICMNLENKILTVQELSKGNPSEVYVSVRKVVECALLYKSSNVILVHNHPSGSVMASREDILLTGNVKDALNKVDINLCDHVIVTENDNLSFKNFGLF